MDVSFSAVATLCDANLLTLFGEVFEYHAVLGIVDNRSGRNANDDINAVTAMAFFARSPAAMGGFPVVFACEVIKCVDGWVSQAINAPAVSPVSPVRAAVGDEFLSPETYAPIPAVTGDYHNVHFV